jgi:predicted RNA-binding Zn ribbon-like protein
MDVTEPTTHNLDVVIDFVNTLDIDEGTDALATPAALAAWLSEQRLTAPSAIPPSDDDLRAAIELREALRALMLANNGADATPQAGQVLERTARRADLGVHFAGDGSVRLEPRDGGVAGALARLLVPIAQARSAGAWERVKACRADDCQWAFYDRSRNRSGVWCDMAVCGNRTKVRSYRSRVSGT